MYCACVRIHTHTYMHALQAIVCVRVCVLVCVHTCVCPCVHLCMRGCVHTCMRSCVCAQTDELVLCHYIYTPLFLSCTRWSSTYVHTLFIILNRDLTKFLAIFIVFLIGFSGAFFLALQLDRPATLNDADYSGLNNSTM